MIGLYLASWLAGQLVTFLYITVDESVQNTVNATCFSNNNCTTGGGSNDTTTNAGGNTCCDGTYQDLYYMLSGSTNCTACKLFISYPSVQLTKLMHAYNNS